MHSVEINYLYFPPWDSLRFLVYYRGHFSVPETVDRVCVAICLRLTPVLSYNDWTIIVEVVKGKKHEIYTQQTKAQNFVW